MAGEELVLSLGDAVCLALTQEGVGLLEHPKGLKGYLADFMDLDSAEYRVLLRCCDKELLLPYATCAGGGTGALQIAATKAQVYLESLCVIESVTARAIANGIAAGVAAWCGITWDEVHEVDAVSEAESGYKRADECPKRRSAVPGIFIDARERVHISALCISGQPLDQCLDVEVCEFRDVKRRLLRLLGQTSDERINVFAAASDLTLRKYRRICEVLAKANIRVMRWRLPTDALCVGYHQRLWPHEDCHILAVHLGANRCAIGLYEYVDGVFECLSLARADVTADLYRRQSAVADLVAQVDNDFVDDKSNVHLFSSDGAGKTLKICIVDELGHGDNIERALRVSLAKVVNTSWDMVFEFSSLSDAARGLALRGGILTGDVEGMLPLDATWFDVFLDGENGCKLLLGHNTTVPTSKTIVVRANKVKGCEELSLGMSPALIIAESSGKGLRFSVPRPRFVSACNETQEIEVTIDVDSECRCKLTFRDCATLKMLQYSIGDFLQDAERVTVKRKAPQ